jgi:hypothetical protein
MFEAHFTYAESPSSNNELDESSVVFNTPASCWHNLHQCNVRYWITPGKRQSQTALFIYIEFKKSDNSHDYKLIELISTELISTELSTAQYSLQQVQKVISTTPLGEQLDRLKTEQWCQSA